MTNTLNPADREYRVGDRDKVFIKPVGANPKEVTELVEVVVSFLEARKPVFRVISEGTYHNQIFRMWQMVFI